MLRSFVLGVCLTCLGLAGGQAEETCPLCDLQGAGHPEGIAACQTPSTAPSAATTCCPAGTHTPKSCPLLGGIAPTTREPEFFLPKSERDFLARQRWARLPSFEIFEDPLPSPMSLAHPGSCSGPCCRDANDFATLKACYDAAQAGPAIATVSDEAPAPPFSNLTVPMPLADPAAMVVQLFEKLQAAEVRASEASRRLAEAEAELAMRRQAPADAPSAISTPASAAVVTLQMQCFEIDLDAVATSDVELAGICKQALSEKGLAALVARGAFATCCSSSGDCSSDVGCSSTGACSPSADGTSQAASSSTADCGTECAACASCGQCAAQSQELAAAPPAPEEEACCGDAHSFIEDEERLATIVDQLKQAGLLRQVSHPRLMTRSGETARMTVGRQIAYRSGGVHGDQAVQQVSFCDAGTEIEVRPVVVPCGEGRIVQVELRAHWSEIDEAAFRESGLPVCDQRSVQSIVELPAGRTAVVAALVKGDQHAGPATAQRRGRSEFVVLITPRIATPLASNPAGDARR